MNDALKDATRRISGLAELLREKTLDVVKGFGTVEIVSALMTISDMELDLLIRRSQETAGMSKVDKLIFDKSVEFIVKRFKDLEKTYDWTIVLQGAVRYGVVCLLEKHMIQRSRVDRIASREPYGDA